MKKLAFSLFTLFLALTLNAQEFDKARMDSLFQLIDANDKGMGSIAILADGKTVYQNAIGYASVAEKVKATPKTTYRIGSISKTFTATLILQLVEEGKLSLDTKLSKYFPQVKNAEKITVEQLLRHRSGIYNITKADDYDAWNTKAQTQQQMVNRIVEAGSIFEPGTQAAYSNSNYILLTYIAEQCSGQSLQEALQNRICKPCGLNSTYVGGKLNIEKGESYSYTKLDSWERSTETDTSVPGGAGALMSTPDELNRFLHCLFSEKLLNKSTLESMTKTVDGLGLGVFPLPFYDRQAIGHTGGIDAFQSNAFYFPEDKVSVAYTTNGVVTPVNDIMIGILSIYFGRDYELPVFTPAFEVSEEDLESYVGVYSSPTFPLKITISRKGKTLIAQATGQPAFPLDATARHEFKFDQAGLKMQFKPKDKKMTFQQGPGNFELTKE